MPLMRPLLAEAYNTSLAFLGPYSSVMFLRMAFPFLVSGILAGFALAVASFAKALTFRAIFHCTLFLALHLLVLHHLLLRTVLFAFNTHLIALRLLGLDWRTTVFRPLLDLDGF